MYHGTQFAKNSIRRRKATNTSNTGTIVMITFNNIKNKDFQKL